MTRLDLVATLKLILAFAIVGAVIFTGLGVRYTNLRRSGRQVGENNWISTAGINAAFFWRL